jgi:hypothetical protein
MWTGNDGIRIWAVVPYSEINLGEEGGFVKCGFQIFRNKYVTGKVLGV